MEIGDGRCGDWDDLNWIDTGSINSPTDRGEGSVSLADCIKRCDDQSDCPHITWNPGNQVHWCFVWKGACTANAYGAYKTYKKESGIAV